MARAYPADGGFRAYSLAALHDHPAPVRWRVLHDSCDPEPESSDYWIAVERIRTAGDVIRWTSHLLGKRGQGFRQFLEILDGGRISVAAMGVGLAQGAYDLAYAYAK